MEVFSLPQDGLRFHNISVRPAASLPKSMAKLAGSLVFHPLQECGCLRLPNVRQCPVRHGFLDGVGDGTDVVLPLGRPDQEIARSGITTAATRRWQRVELEWSLAGLWAMSLYAVVQIRPGRPVAAHFKSQAAEAFRPCSAITSIRFAPATFVRPRLREAVIDPYPSEQNQSGLPAEEKGDSPPPPARPPSSGPALEKSHWRKHYESKQQYG